MYAIKTRNLLTNIDHYTPCNDWADACQLLRVMRADLTISWQENVDFTVSIEEVENDFNFDDQPDWN